MPLLTVSHIVKAAGAPEYVKLANVHDDAEYEFSTKEATYISYASALVKGASGDRWQEVEDMVRFWGITPDCAKVRAKYAELNQPTELPDQDFALNVQYAGDKVRKFAAFDAPSTIKSAVSFYEAKDAFPFEWRHDVATKLLAKTALYKATLPEYVETYLQKAACYGAVGEAELENALISRDATCSPQHRETFEKVAEVISALMDSRELRADRDFVKAAMVAIDQYDTMTGNFSPVEQLIPDSLVVSQLEKVAASHDAYIVKLVNGHQLDTRELTKEALEMVDSKLAKLGAAELAEVLPTLPRQDADLLVRAVA